MTMNSQEDFQIKSVYMKGFYNAQSPINLKYIAAINGVSSPPLHKGFNYLELGCGFGVSLNIFASCYPQGNFYGVDGKAEHIEDAVSMAEKSQLENIQYIQSSFEALDIKKLPQMDFIVLQGVWSLVGPPIHTHIRHIIKNKLKKGGILYINYNVMPGWNVHQIMKNIFLEVTAAMPDDEMNKLQQGLSYLQLLKQSNCALFTQYPTASLILEDWLKQPVQYLAYELLNPQSRAYYFSEVHQEMQALELSFIGNSPSSFNYLAATVPPDLRALLRQIPDRPTLEIHRDFIANTAFRNDVYICGAPKEFINDNIEALLGDLYFGTVMNPEDIQFKVTNSLGINFEFEKEKFSGLSAALAEKSHNLKELGITQGSDSEKLRLLKMLVMGEQFCPMAQSGALFFPLLETSTLNIPLEFNKVALKNDIFTTPTVLLASPVLGSAIGISHTDALIIRALGETPQAGIPQKCWEYLKKYNRSLSSNGAVIEGEEAHKREFEIRLQEFIQKRFKKYCELGIVQVNF